MAETVEQPSEIQAEDCVYVPRTELERLQAIEERYAGPDVITEVWHVDDVKAVDDTLTDDEAREILQQIDDGHDASIGINWDMIETYVSSYKYKKEKQANATSDV